MWTPVFTVLPILLSTRITVEQDLQIPALNHRPPNLHSQACRIKWPLGAVAVDFTGHHFLLQYPQKQFIPHSLLLFPSLAFVITKHFVIPSVDVSFFHSFIHQCIYITRVVIITLDTIQRERDPHQHNIILCRTW